MSTRIGDVPKVSAAVRDRGARRYWRAVWTIVRKDLRVEARGREVLTSSVVFSLLVLLIFNFALDLVGDAVALVAPGVLWVTILFSGVLVLGRTFARERERGGLEALLLAPLDRGALLIAKVLGNLILLGAIEVIAVPAFLALYNVEFHPWRLAATIALGTIGISTVGTLFAAIAANTRARESMLPLLLFPVLVPLLIGAVKGTTESLTGAVAAGPPWLGLLVAFDAIFLAVAYLLFDYVLEG